MYSNNTLNAGIEFQNGTLKIQIHDMYNKIGNKSGFNNNWAKAFSNISKSPKLINPSKKKGRYYVSKTVKKITNWLNNRVNWNKEIQQCINELQKAVDNHP